MRAVILLIVLGAFLIGTTAHAEKTRVVVRAKSKDAKFIGTGMGGALVIIRDSDTGEIIAQGLTEGGTGDTTRIMLNPLQRGKSLSDADTARFEITVDIELPQLVDIEVHAPHAQMQSKVKSSTQAWLIPGKDMTGDGIVLEVPGFAVDILLPQAAETIRMQESKKLTVPIQANVVMMCGCPIIPGGVWDANEYEVRAIILHDGKKNTALPMRYAGRSSTFGTDLPITKKGVYEILVYAYDPATGNTGVDRATVVVK